MKFSIDKLLPGMVLNTSLIYQGGVLLSKGATVSERHLKQMKSWGVDIFETQDPMNDFSEVFVPAAVAPVAAPGAAVSAPTTGSAPPAFVPKGYDIDGGSTYVIENSIEHTTSPVVLEKSVVVQGSVNSDVHLESFGNIQIAGDVQPGSKLSAKGSITVRGTILGSEEQPVVVHGDSLSAAVAEHASITVRQSVEAASLRHCITRAGAEINVMDENIGILGGESEAGLSIKAASVKGGEKPAILRVLLLRQKQLFQAVSKIEKTIQEREEEHAKLEKVIEVIRLLGDKVVTLPPEKKQELALQSKRYMELKGEVAELHNTKARIQEEMEEEVMTMDRCPIQLRQIFPAVELTLGTAVLKINARQSSTGYYHKHGRILAVSERF